MMIRSTEAQPKESLVRVVSNQISQLPYCRRTPRSQSLVDNQNNRSSRQQIRDCSFQLVWCGFSPYPGHHCSTKPRAQPTNERTNELFIHRIRSHPCHHHQTTVLSSFTGSQPRLSMEVTVPLTIWWGWRTNVIVDVGPWRAWQFANFPLHAIHFQHWTHSLIIAAVPLLLPVHTLKIWRGRCALKKVLITER